MIELQKTPVMTGVMCPGGWHYKENGKLIVEEAISYEDLINKVAQYRGFCGLPLGDPQADVDRYICESFPNMCGIRPKIEEEGVDKVELSYGQPVQKTPRERVMAWVANRMQKVGEIEYVDQDEAERRAAICDACPKKIQWNQAIEGCPGCEVYVQEAEAMAVKLRANKMTDQPISGFACAVAGHDLVTACFLEEPALRHRKNYLGKLPHKCWMNDL